MRKTTTPVYEVRTNIVKKGYVRSTKKSYVHKKCIAVD